MKWRKAKWDELASYLSGEMTAAEEIAYKAQLLHEMDTEEISKMEEHWKYTGSGDPGKSEKTGAAWEKLHRRLEADGLLERSSKSETSRMGTLRSWRIAATILMVIGLGIPATYLLTTRETKNTEVTELYSESGTRTLDLPDGSRVYLNQGSGVSFSDDFRENRSLELKGEAFFEVMSDPVNPFTVRSGKVMISVLGTSFNVRQKENSGDVEVLVESGKVRMSMEETQQYITLKAGDMGYAEEKNLGAGVQVDPNYLSWKSKDFIFVEAQLDKVLRTLERAYHVEIHFDPEMLSDRLITSTYREQTIDSILETIATAFDYQVKKRNDQYYLEP